MADSELKAKHPVLWGLKAKELRSRLEMLGVDKSRITACFEKRELVELLIQAESNMGGDLDEAKLKADEAADEVRLKEKKEKEEEELKEKKKKKKEKKTKKDGKGKKRNRFEEVDKNKDADIRVYKRIKGPIIIPVKVPEDIKQTLIWVSEDRKGKMLREILSDKRYNVSPILVICKDKTGAEMLRAEIKKKMERMVGCIHAGKPIEVREALLNSFSRSALAVMVSTRCIRKLEVPPVRTVIMFDMPQCLDDYKLFASYACHSEGGSSLALVNNHGSSQPVLCQIVDSFPKSQQLPPTIRNWREAYGRETIPDFNNCLPSELGFGYEK